MAASPSPPASVLSAMGMSSWDPSRYAWDPTTGVLTFLDGSGSLNFGGASTGTDQFAPGTGGADPSLGTNVALPGGMQNFGQGITPISDVGNGTATGTTDPYGWYANQKSGNLDNFLAASAALIGGPLLATSLSGAGAAGAANGVGDAGGAAGGAGSGSAFGGGGGTSLFGLNGTAPITGTAIDATGSAIGAPALFGTSSIPYDALGGALGGVGSVGSAASGAGSLFSGGADPGASPNLAAPGAQTPGGYDLASGTQIPNLPGANMASSLPSWLQSLLPYSGLIGSGLGLLDSLTQPNKTTTTQGGTSNSTNTTQLQLPSQLTGAAGTALDRANQLLTNGRQFAPTPYLINATADRLNNLGQNTAPTTSSFASGANINPYLDMTFNAAADSTQNRLGTEFANAGQVNSPQHQGDRSQELQTLAAGIYGPGYQNAQQLQYGAQEAGVSRGLQQQDSNLNRTLQGAQLALPIGSYIQQQQQQQLDAPQANLSTYLGQLGGLAPFFPGTSTQTQATNQTGNVTQPLYNNPITSAVGGGIMGSYYGNLLGGQPQQQGQAYAQTPVNRQQAQSYNPYTTPATISYDQTGMPQATFGGNLAGINNLYAGTGQSPMNAGFGSYNTYQY